MASPIKVATPSFPSCGKLKQVEALIAWKMRANPHDRMARGSLVYRVAVG